jgi:hypothetical protein
LPTAQDRGLFLAFRRQDFRAFLAFRLHLAAHRLDEVSRRGEILDLDPGYLDAPGVGRRIDDPQQALVDIVALGQHVIEAHGADHGTNIRHRKVGDRAFEIVDLICGAR